MRRAITQQTTLSAPACKARYEAVNARMAAAAERARTRSEALGTTPP